MKKILLATLLLLSLGAFSQTLVKDINTGASGCQPGSVVKVGNTILFRANNGPTSALNFELWETNGTNAGTAIVEKGSSQEINTGGSSFPQEITNINGVAYFSASDGSANNGIELWKFDPSGTTASLVKNIAAGSANSNPSGFTQRGTSGEFYFSAESSGDKELYKSDGTNGGTSLVSNLNASGSSNPAELVSFNNEIYFAADNGTNGTELFKTNGTTITLVKDINPTGSSFPTGLTVFNGALYFAASDGSNGIEVWKSDGTNSGTVQLKNINTTTGASSNPGSFTVAGNKLYFVADDGNLGNELWHTDGTTAGTVQVDINDGGGSSNPTELTAVGNLLFFAATRGAEGNELFYFDPTGSGNETLAADIESGSLGSGPQYLTNAYGDLYFSASTSTNGREPYKWSNTSSGSSVSIVSNMNAGAASSDPRDFVVLGSSILFFADNGTTGTELYSTSLSNAPTITPISDKTTNENVPLTFSITINSAISPVANLALSGSSSDTVLVKSSGFSFSGTGSTRSVTITPENFQNGTATLTINVCDGSSNCISTSFDITVNPVNNVPVVGDFSLTLNEDNLYSFTTGDFDANYNDADGSPMDSIRIHSLPTNGDLILNNSEITSADLPRSLVSSLIALLRFSPDTNWNGTTTFQWDAYGGGDWASATKTVSMVVNPVNDVPVIVSQPTKSVNEDNTLTFISSDFGGASVYADVENQPLDRVRFNSVPRNGTMLNAGDTITGPDLPLTIQVANLGDISVVPDLNYFGSDFFLYRVGDGVGLSLQDTFNISVAPVNDPPTLSAFSVTTDEDTDYTFATNDFLNNYSDVENSNLDSVWFQALPLNGTLSLNGNPIATNGKIGRLQIPSLTFSPAANYFGSTTFQVRVSDGTDYSAQTVITVNINSVNDAPVANKVTRTGTEDNAITFSAANFSAQYSDVENDAFAGIQITSLSADGTLELAGNAIAASSLPVSVTSGNISNLVFTPNADWNGTTYLMWKAFDGMDYSDVADSVEIILSPVNDAPQVFGFPQSVLEDSSLVIFRKDFTDNFVDVDGDSIVHLQFMQKPSNGELAVSGIQQTVYPFIASSTVLDAISYTPDADFSGRDTVEFRGFDGALYSNTAEIRFTIDPVNDAPTFAGLSKDVDEDFILNFFSSDFQNDSVFIDLEDDQLTSIKVMSLPSNGILRLNNTPVQVNNVLTMTQVGNLTYRGNTNFNGMDSFTLQLNDGNAFSNTGTVTINVNGVNDKPVITSPGVQVVSEDNPIAIKGISLADVDSDPGNLEVNMSVTDATLSLASVSNLSFTTGDGTADASLRFQGTRADINAALDSVIYDPNTNFNGFDNVYITVSDLGNTGSGGAKGDTASIPVQVDGINDTTIFSVPGAQTVFEGQNLTVPSISLSDVDGDNLNVSVRLVANNGIITLSGTALLTFIEGDGTQDSVMEFFGQLNAVNPALNNLTYRSDIGFFGPDQLNLSVVDSASGSVATDNEIIPITVNPRPVSFINNPLTQAKCEGLDITLSVTPEGTPPFSYQWLKDGQPILSNDANNQTFILTGIDTSDIAQYACEVTNAAGTQTSTNANVNVYDRPNVNFGYSEACTGDLVQFTDSTSIIGGDSIQSYVWDMGDGASFGIPNPLHTFSSSNPFNVKLTTTSNRGCTDSTIKVVAVTPKPQVLFSVSTECRGDSTIFTNATTVTAGQLSYTWVFGDGDSSTAQDAQHLYASVGTYTSRLIARNNGKCETSTTRTVTINPNPNANFTYTDICLGAGADFTNTSTISTGTNSYIWDFGDGAVSNNVSPTRVYNQADTFDVKLLATSNNGCMDSVTQAIIVYPKPTVSFSAASVCSIDTVQFTNASSVPFGGISYQWYFGDGNSSILQAPEHFYTAVGAYQPKLIVTGIFGCQDSLSKTVNVYPTPVANFTYSNVCFGTTVDFSNTSSVLNGLNSYNWTFGNGTSSINADPSRNYSAAGNYPVTLTVVSDQQCTNSITKTVRVFPTPVADFTAPSVCFGDTMSISNNSSLAFGGASSVWSLGNGTTVTDTAFNDLDYLYSSDGFYQIKLRITADSGCADSMTQNVQVYPVAQVSTTSQDVACNGIPSGSISVNTLGGTPPFLYSINGGSTYQSSSTFSNLAASGYLITTLDGNGCRSDDPGNPIVLNQAPPLVVVADSVKNVNCFGDSSGFILANGSGGTPPYLFSVDSTSFQSSPNFGGLPQGGYSLVLRDGNNCVSSVPVTVAQPSTPISSTFTFKNILCRGDSSGSIAIQGQGSVGGYEYSVDGGATYHPDSNFTNLPAGSYVLVVRDTNNCSTSQGLNLTQPATAIQASLTASNDVACFGDSSGSFSVSASGGTGAKTYSLNPSIGFGATTNFMNLPSGSYTVYARDFNGCLDSISVSLGQPSSPLTIDSVSASDVVCFGTPTGQIAVFGMGGTPSYSYALNSGASQASNSFTLSSGGTYIITVIDSNNCTATDTAVINEPAQLSLVTGVQNETCEFDSTGAIGVNGNGGVSPYQFSLDNSIYSSTDSLRGLTNGTYTVYIRDANGCITDQSVTIGADSLLPNAGFSSFVVGNTVTFNNTSSDGKAFFWNFGDGNTSTDVSPTHLYGNGAIYSVLLAAENFCGTDSLVKTIDVNSTGIDEVSNKNGLVVFPNPAPSSANLQINTSLVGENATLIIYDMNGKMLHNEVLPTNTVLTRTLQASQFAAGEYFIELRGTNKTLTQKLILGL